MAAPFHVFTISRVAAMLGEEEDLLWDLVDQLEPEDGCLWVYGVGDEHTIAFTDRGLESLQEIIAEHRRSSPTRGP
jgi:hypothetical protein